MTSKYLLQPKDHWTLKTGYFEDPNPAIQVQTLPLEGPRSLGQLNFTPRFSHLTSIVNLPPWVELHHHGANLGCRRWCPIFLPGQIGFNKHKDLFWATQIMRIEMTRFLHNQSFYYLVHVSSIIVVILLLMLLLSSLNMLSLYICFNFSIYWHLSSWLINFESLHLRNHDVWFWLWHLIWWLKLMLQMIPSQILPSEHIKQNMKVVIIEKHDFIPFLRISSVGSFPWVFESKIAPDWPAKLQGNFAYHDLALVANEGFLFGIPEAGGDCYKAGDCPQNHDPDAHQKAWKLPSECVSRGTSQLPNQNLSKTSHKYVCLSCYHQVVSTKKLQAVFTPFWTALGRFLF